MTRERLDRAPLARHGETGFLNGGGRCPSLLSGRPERPVEGSVVDRFAQVVALDLFAVVEVGDCPADSENLVVGAGGEAGFLHRRFQEGFRFGLQLAVLADLPGGHVSVERCRFSGEPLSLDGAGPDDLLPHAAAVGAGLIVREFPERNRRDFDVDVDPVEHGA